MGAPGGLTRTRIQWAGLLLGPALAIAVYLFLPAEYRTASGGTAGLGHAGRASAALAAWMGVWWLTEAIDIAATALLPIAILPLSGAAKISEATAPYANDLIFLFMGGFIIALAVQRWGLDRRLALLALRVAGGSPPSLVGAFMAVTALISMWVSNTATALMMLPIALSVIDLVLGEHGFAPMAETGKLPATEGRNFAICLMLAVAYGASIGGIGTIVGTPPNLFLAAYIRNRLHGEVSFVRWLGVGLPLVAVFLPLAWLLLTRLLYPVRLRAIKGGRALFARQYRALGPISRGEWATIAVFALTASCWILRPLLAAVRIAGSRPLAGLTDSGIAIAAALLLFVIPVDVRKREFAMRWDDAARLPWGILILFGGGLSLAAAIDSNGLGTYLGHQASFLGGLPGPAMVMFVTALAMTLTELTSNTAATTTLVPILAGIAPGLGQSPMLLIVPATIAASCAFMLPVATPPNAIVFGSGYLTIPQMAKAGLWLNAIGIALITALTYAAAIPLLGP